MRKTLLYLLFGLNLLTVLSLLISYFSVYISPDKWWIPSVFGLAYPLILILNIAFVVLWLFTGKRFVWISLIVVILGWGFVSRFIQFKGKNIEKGDIKVVSFNVQHFSAEGNTNQKGNAGEIVKFLEEINADIICLQEVRLRKNAIFNLEQTVKSITSINHYQYARSSTTYGSVTMTRYPIIKMGEIRFANTRNISIYTDVLVGKDTVRIFNVHLQSYHIDPKQYSAIIDSPDLTEEEDLREMKEIGVKFKEAVIMRAEQAREIRKHIDESPYSVILCGDFNDTPTSYSYYKTRGDLKDAFVCSGKGIGTTYIGKLPSLRIDYIFHSKDFNSYNFKALDFRMSDHLPISCELTKAN